MREKENNGSSSPTTTSSFGGNAHRQQPNKASGQVDPALRLCRDWCSRFYVALCLDISEFGQGDQRALSLSTHLVAGTSTVCPKLRRNFSRRSFCPMVSQYSLCNGTLLGRHDHFCHARGLWLCPF